MHKKENWSNLPECESRGCKIKTDRLGHCNNARFDEAADISSLRLKLRTRRSLGECSCDRKEVTSVRTQMNGGTFIRFTGPTNKSTVNPVARVMISNSKSRSTCGCFLEKSLDGKPRAFNLQANDVSESGKGEYFRAVTIWQGCLNKHLNVRVRRSSGQSLPRANRISSEYFYCNGELQAGKKKFYSKAKNRQQPEVGTPRCY